MVWAVCGCGGQWDLIPLLSPNPPNPPNPNPKKSLTILLPSEKEETEFLWQSCAKATLQMFTRGRFPLLFCYKWESIGASVPWGGS